MKRSRKRDPSSDPLLVCDDPSFVPRPRRNFARWRAFSLSLVYVVFALHILHWRITGKTLAPLELNEVMYTLELGIITAGFLFMCFLVLGTLVFGRFFCSWACHIMVLQDGCAWILRKLGIRRKPIRSRLLLLVPPLTAFYMFIWPQILRAWDSRAFPEFHFRTDSQGWASFVTNNFWRNLPSAPIIVLTFLVCGFVIVYLLGSRTFCSYVCPYGAIFALADRFSPGRIRVSDACRQCGTCTAACTSGVRVHEEVKQHGMVVNSACMKDLDCVSACPQGALQYGFAKPALWASIRSGGRFGRLPYDFSWTEEMLIAVLFVVGLLTFRGLYSRIPFLLSLALGAILGYLAVVMVRLVTRPDVTLATVHLKTGSRVTRAGRVCAVVIAVLAVFVGHSAVVRYHEFAGLKGVIAFAGETDADRRYTLARSARGHLQTADRWGLLRNERVELGLSTLTFHLERFDEAVTYASRVLERRPHDAETRLRLGQALVRSNRTAEAEREFRTVIRDWRGASDEAPRSVLLSYQALGELLARRGNYAEAEQALRAAVALDPESAAAQASLASVVAELGGFDEAVERLREAVRLDPEMGSAHYNLGTILAHHGRFEEAIESYRRALATGLVDAELHNNLGFALLRTGNVEQSLDHLERAVSLDPDSADAHFNLGVLLASRQEPLRASEHFRIAVRLDPRYARMLEEGP